MEKIEIVRRLIVDEIEDVFCKDIKPFGNSAYVILPKKYIGREAHVIIKKLQD